MSCSLNFFVCRCFGVTKSLSHQLKRSWSYRGGHKWSLKTYFALLANLGFCSKYLCKILVSKLICSYSFVHACKFLNVLAFSVLNEGNFWQVLVASKASSCQYSCSWKKLLCLHGHKYSQRPFDTPHSKKMLVSPGLKCTFNIMNLDFARWWN